MMKTMTAIGISLAISGAALGQDWVQTARLAADVPAERETFGSDLDFDGDSIIVGVPNADGDLVDEGAAYVFVRDGDGWRRQAVLRSMSPEPGGSFGSAVAISGDLAVVGSLRGDGMETDSGSATVFRRSGDAWVPAATIAAMDGETDALFGHCVAIDHERIAVGAVSDRDTGSVYIFEPDASTWSQAAKLQAVSFPMTRDFGTSVSINGEVLAVGAVGSGVDGDRPGAVYVFERIEGSWIETARLVGSGLQDGDRFGWDVDMSGHRIVAGAIYAHRLQGRAFVFLHDGEEWQEEAEFMAPDTERSTFGTVGIDGDIAVIGAQNFDLGATSTGRAFVYHFQDGLWTLRDQINSGNPTELALFGNAVAVAGDTVVAAAALESDDAFRAGAAYVFGPNPCPADLDGDGELTIFDFLAFQNAFDAMDPVADFDRDGDFTIFDFLAFQNAFDAGCP